ncbi:MAG TPA: transferase [Pseudolabrys sp.]|nr:transferase [Pseudolabrys sp.]
MGQIFRSEHSAFVPVADPAAMAEQVMLYAPASDAEALKLLRENFPGRPLSARVAALVFLMRRRTARPDYSPR